MTEDEFDSEEETEEDEEEDTSDLEAEFRKVFKSHIDKIDKQLEIASKAIAKAEKLAEKYGLPFSSNVSPLSQSYFPESFVEKFGDLDSDTVYDITGAYTSYYNEGAGWEHSAVC